MNVARRRMSPEQFLAWSLDQEDGRWELVGGRPLRAMTGATRRHDRIVVNLIAALKIRLRGSACEPTTSDQASIMANGNVRRPDVTIDCGPARPDALETSEPAVFFEVLSPSTRKTDLVAKADEYRALASLKHFVLVDPDRPLVTVWSRGEAGWSSADVEGLEAEAPLAAIGLSLPLADIYDGLDLS